MENWSRDEFMQFFERLPLAGEDTSANTRSFVWFSLERNLQRSGDGWLWGKWSNSQEEACADEGLLKPLELRYLLRFGPVGMCGIERVFLVEVPKRLS